MASGLRASHGYTFAGSGHLTRHTCGKLYAPMVVLPSFGTCSRVSMHLWLRGLSVAWRGVMRRSFFAGLQILVDELVS